MKVISFDKAFKKHRVNKSKMASLFMNHFITDNTFKSDTVLYDSEGKVCYLRTIYDQLVFKGRYIRVVFQLLNQHGSHVYNNHDGKKFYVTVECDMVTGTTSIKVPDFIRYNGDVRLITDILNFIYRGFRFEITYPKTNNMVPIMGYITYKHNIIFRCLITSKGNGMYYTFNSRTAYHFEFGGPYYRRGDRYINSFSIQDIVLDPSYLFENIQVKKDFSKSNIIKYYERNNFIYIWTMSRKRSLCEYSIFQPIGSYISDTVNVTI
jgi:hypothetical protein